MPIKQTLKRQIELQAVHLAHQPEEKQPWNAEGGHFGRANLEPPQGDDEDMNFGGRP